MISRMKLVIITPGSSVMNTPMMISLRCTPKPRKTKKHASSALNALARILL